MRYKELFQITVKHPYYLDQWVDIEIYPDARTERLLKSLNVITKSTSSGFKVVAPVSTDGSFNGKLEELRACRFLMYPTHSSFIHVTELNTSADNEVLHFTNVGLLRSSHELKVGAITHSSSSNGFVAIGVMTIDTTGLIAKDGSVAPNYQLVFECQTVVWKYYFIHNTEDADFEISSREEQHSFSEMDLQSDSIGNTLKVKFPESYIIGFQSDQAIPYSRKPVKDLKLNQKISDYSISLPYPEIGRQGIQILNINNKV